MIRSRRGALLALWALLALGLVYVRPLGAQSQDEVVVTVNITGYSPSLVDLKTGATVTWRNADVADYPVVRGAHQVEADDGSFVSPVVSPGASWSMRFLAPGTFGYHCKIHPLTMRGSVVATGNKIEPPAAEKDVAIVEDNPNDTKTWGFKPADLVVETGTTITWRNNGAQTHTVTAEDKSFDSGNVAPGTTYKRKFETPGAFRYFCTPHPWMKALIRVSAPGAAPPPEPPKAEPPPKPAQKSQAARPTGAALTARGPLRFEAEIVERGISDPQSWGFDPARLEVRAGDTVVWRNTGSATHSVTAEDKSFDSGNLTPGATFERKFDTTGVVQYRCTPHPWMKGVVAVGTVAPELPAPRAGTIGAPGETGAEGVAGSSQEEGVEPASANGRGARAGGRDEEFPTRGVVAVFVVALIVPLVFLFTTGFEKETFKRDFAPAREYFATFWDEELAELLESEARLPGEEAHDRERVLVGAGTGRGQDT